MRPGKRWPRWPIPASERLAVLALPEVEVVRRDLEKEIVGRRIKDVEVRPGSNSMKIIKRHGRRKEFQDLLLGARVDRIARLGTWLVLELDSDRALVIDLGDTAHVLKTSATEAIATYTHIVIGFTIGGQLRLIDPKLTGEVFVTPTAELTALDGGLPAMIDPLGAPLAWQHFSALLEQEKTTVKDLLMDERFIRGLGDIYSDEILFVAGIRFDRQSHKLSSQDVRRLYRALIEVLQDAVKARGTTWGDHDFKDLQGDPGHYQLELRVFERQGEACRRCRTPIARAVTDSRENYFCPQCQS